MFADKDCPVPEPVSANIGRLIFLGSLFFLTFISRFIFAPLMPTIVRELDITPSQAGSLFLVISLGFFVAQICSGFLTSKVNHRGTLVISTLGVGCALLIFKLSSTLLVIRTVLFFLGMAAGLHMPSAMASITAMVNRQDWGKALAIHQTAAPLSLVLGPLLTVVLLSWITWQALLAVMGGIAIVVGLAFLRFGRCGEFPGEAPRPSIVKLVFTCRSFWILVILFAFSMGGGIGTYSMLPLYLVKERGFDGELAITLLGLSRVSGLFMAFIAGWFTDYLGEKKFMFIVVMTAGVATILLGTTSGLLLTIMIFLQPAVQGCFFTAGFAALARIVQPNFRSVASAFTTPIAFLIGGGLLPLVIGYMGENYSFGTGIVLIGGLLILSSGLVHLLSLIEKMEEGC